MFCSFCSVWVANCLWLGRVKHVINGCCPENVKAPPPQHPPSSIQNDAESSRMLTHALKGKHMMSQAKLLWMWKCCLHLSEGDASGWEAVVCPTGVGVGMWITAQFPPASEWKAFHSRISRSGSSPALNLLRCRCIWAEPSSSGHTAAAAVWEEKCDARFTSSDLNSQI